MVRKLITNYPELDECREAIEKAGQMLINMYASGGKLLVCGNGGSAADSEHIVGELMKGFHKKRPVATAFRAKMIELFGPEGEGIVNQLQGALPAISLVNHSALSTAFSNDIAGELVFAQQVFGYGAPGDILLALSTSGNSANVLNALMVAKAIDMNTIALTGRDGGKMVELADLSIIVPHQETPDIQERHLPIYHTICSVVEEVFFAT